ncbi:MAG TPA: hypothetical protein VMV93_06220 [Chloroflexota bacterium]|nr:hypothetical protein [Chloroflexota bacterium]
MELTVEDFARALGLLLRGLEDASGGMTPPLPGVAATAGNANPS